MNDRTQELERHSWLHIHGQDMWHDSAMIRGNRTALEALRDAVTRALETGTGTMAAYVSDGEGYEILVEMKSYDDMLRDPLPYREEFANPQANKNCEREARSKEAEPAQPIMADECRVCHKQIYSGELCENCAIGNDPFVTSKFNER